MAVYKASAIQRLQVAENNIQNVSESVGRAQQRLDDMSTCPDTPDTTHALTQLEKRITQLNEQVEAVQSKVDQAFFTKEKISEKLDNILTTGKAARLD